MSEADSCPICSRTDGLTNHHIYGRGQSKLTMRLCASCHLCYNQEAGTSKPGKYTRLIWEYVIKTYCD